MKKNFRIDQGNALIKGTNTFDLHNCYDFSGFSLEAKRARLGFEPNQEWGTGLPPVLILFDGLECLEVNMSFFGDHPRSSSDEIEIDEMGYKNPDDFDYDWLLTEQQANNKDHIIFRFFGGRSIRIFASQARLKEAIGKELGTHAIGGPRLISR